jgi:heme-degrading monooxygenase HmoA
MGAGRPAPIRLAYTRRAVFARVHSFAIGEEDRSSTDEVVEQILPTIRELEGYRGMVVLSELEGARVMTMSLWQTAEAMDSSKAVTEKIREAESANRQVEGLDASTYRVVTLDLSD